MAGPYYVNIGDPASWVGHDGVTDNTDANAWLGISGLQYAFDTVTVGNGPVYVKGTGDGSKMKTIASTQNLVGIFQRGEQVTWDAAASNGIVSEIAANAPTVIEVVTGTLANPDSLVGVTSGATCDINGAVAQKAYIIDVDTNAGTNGGGYIKFIGCTDDANYTRAGTTNRAIIDSHDEASTIYAITSAGDLIWLENLEAIQATKGFLGVSDTSNGVVFLNCCANNHSSHGFDIQRSEPIIIMCVSYLNGGAGFYYGYGGFRTLLCCARDNAGAGFGLVGGTVIGCIAHNNTDDGITASTVSVLIQNCVSDSNGDDGIVITSNANIVASVIVGTRITNQSGAGDIGLYANSENVLSGWNYFEGNTDNVNSEAEATYYIIPNGDGTTTNKNEANPDADTDTNQGYAEAVANDNFATGYTSAADPQLRRTAITVPWS